jgi:hypothetical protein
MIEFDRINQSYTAAFEKYGNTSAAVLIPKNNQDVRFKSVLNFLPQLNDGVLSIMDFGCGLGHLSVFLEQNMNIDFVYSGVEVNTEFLSFNKQLYSKAHFFDRDAFFTSDDSYDVIVSIGTFNLMYSNDFETHRDFVYDEILRLWAKTNKTLHINFMSTVVDFTQENAYHQDLGDLYRFACEKLSRNIIIDSSYLPYEFSFIVNKENL